MIKRKLTIINKLGLHARTSAKLVALTSKFSSKIKLCKGDKCVDGKNIMDVMMLAATEGTKINFEIDGKDEKQAMKEIKALINSGFGEEKCRE
ncbi:MAG: HPr family phosphocarrier protein [Gammaproteobacteria bacterium]|jgi:phosphocarrier protein